MTAVCSTRAARAGGALLASIITLASAGDADAQPIGISLKGAPPITVSVPILSTPGTPSIEASAPSINVAVPGVEVSTPSVSVSGPNISVSAPAVSVSAPSPPVTSSPPPPVTPSPPSEPGGGEPHTPSGPPPSTVANSTSPAAAADPPGSSTAPTDSSSLGARPTRQQALAGAQQSPGAHVMLQPHTHRGRAHRGGAGTGAIGVDSNAPPSLAAATPNSPPRGGASKSSSRAPARSSGNLLEKIGRHIPLPIPVPDWSKPIIIALLALAIGLGMRSRLSDLRVRRLEQQRTTMQRDLDVMQAALVPPIPAQLDGLAVSVAYRPAEGPAAGGDFYDLFVLKPGKVAIILGDVAGHGHQALTQAALTRYTLRAYLQAGLEPRAALALTGRVLADPTGENFATVAAAVYDTRKGRLTYACAGHPPPIVHGCHTHEALTLCASPPIGWRVPTGRRQTTVSLSTGAVACFFSDGLIEARRGKELLGRERVAEILAALGPQPTASELLHEVQQAALTTPDDMAACILLANTPTTHAHIEELEVDSDELDAPSTRHFLEACHATPREITQALERACDIASTCRSAVLRAQIQPGGTTVTVATPHPPKRRQATAGARPTPALAAT